MSGVEPPTGIFLAVGLRTTHSPDSATKSYQWCYKSTEVLNKVVYQETSDQQHSSSVGKSHVLQCIDDVSPLRSASDATTEKTAQNVNAANCRETNPSTTSNGRH